MPQQKTENKLRILNHLDDFHLRVSGSAPGCPQQFRTRLPAWNGACCLGNIPVSLIAQADRLFSEPWDTSDAPLGKAVTVT
jgi:hypothetical protein